MPSSRPVELDPERQRRVVGGQVFSASGHQRSRSVPAGPGNRSASTAGRGSSAAGGGCGRGWGKRACFVGAG
jgi:hypothetical protein